MAPRFEPQRTLSSTLAEEVLTVVLPSGLRVMLCPKPGFKKKYACYSTFYGSIDSEFVAADGQRVRVPDGIAHFLEHTLFETEEGNVSDLFAMTGAYNNASTSFTTTTYLFASTTRFWENLDLLLGFVEKPAFRAEKVDKERGIIEQEIKQYADHPGWVGYMGLLENLFERHPLRIDIAGTAESIANVTPALLQSCYDTFYHPSNMILFVVGDLEPEELFGHVAANSRHGDAAEVPPGALAGAIERIYPDEPASILNRETRKQMAVAVPKLLVGFKDLGVAASGLELVRRDFAMSLGLEMIFGRSSDLYSELYESQLILDDFGASYSPAAGVASCMVGGDTPEPDRLREVIVKRGSRAVDDVSAKDFEREKRRFLGGYVASFNSLEYIASHFTHYRFYDFDLFEAVDVIASLDRETVAASVAELLDPENWASYVIEPLGS